jgi:hypothetical protein
MSETWWRPREKCFGVKVQFYQTRLLNWAGGAFQVFKGQVSRGAVQSEHRQHFFPQIARIAQIQNWADNFQPQDGR